MSNLSSSLLSSSASSESASISLVSSNIRLRFASGSSSSSPSPFSSCLFGVFVAGSGVSETGADPPFNFAKCAASACNNSARRSRGWLSASPPCPGFLQTCQMRPCDMKNNHTGLSAGYELVRVVDGMLVLVVPPFLWPKWSQSQSWERS